MRLEKLVDDNLLLEFRGDFLRLPQVEYLLLAELLNRHLPSFPTLIPVFVQTLGNYC